MECDIQYCIVILAHMACIDTEAGTETEHVYAFGTKIFAEMLYRLMAQGGCLQTTVLPAFIGTADQHGLGDACIHLSIT